uniref:Regulatory protein, FmdB family n=2 Tax=Candidatus Bipolaricaulota TaxID=67810 RepID=H5S9Y6_9BACT|nr:regulatory protein, FmdB family [uncultured Acetothermia bacterium]BAL59240.1 regulatory protein, FmdB family [Candidatus Acetothermum autotrophicum]
MPLYRYLCESCGHTFSVLDSFDSPDQRDCEECGAKQARRLPSRVGIQYKGQGFYTTNYGRKRSEHSPNGAAQPAKNSSNS